MPDKSPRERELLAREKTRNKRQAALNWCLTTINTILEGRAQQAAAPYLSCSSLQLIGSQNRISVPKLSVAHLHRTTHHLGLQKRPATMQALVSCLHHARGLVRLTNPQIWSMLNRKGYYLQIISRRRKA